MLRKLHAEYADKGLVIVGLTRFYNFAWNEVTQSANQASARVPKTDELKMLKEFAKANQLKHRIAIQADDSIAQHYGVNGIPHVVLIDAEQKVRLVRVGTGGTISDEIEDMVKRLLSPEEE